MNGLLMKPPRKRYYIRESIAYTEDRIKVQRLNVCSISLKLPENTLKNHFQHFGNILEWGLTKDPEMIIEPCLSWEVLFANPIDAAKALKTRTHRIDGIKFKVEPGYSWRQPDAYGSPEEQQLQESSPILKLNNDCWFHILQFLRLRDKVRFARTCQSFRAIYQMATARQYTAVNTRQFNKMTLWDIRDFYQLSGDQIQVLECEWPMRDTDERFGFIAVYCRKLISLSLGFKLLTKESMLKMPTSIEKLDLGRCLRVDDFPIICKHFTKLRKLNLAGAEVKDSICLSLVEDNCCPTLEVLCLSSCCCPHSKCEILAQLPSLKSLAIHSKGGVSGSGTELIDQLVEHQAEQLESLEVDCASALPRRQLSQMAKLTGLRTLILPFWYGVSEDVLKEFASLKKLERICLNYNGRSDSGILDLFIACRRLSHLSISGYEIPAKELVQGIRARVRHEKSIQDLQRQIPVEIGLPYDLSGTRVILKNHDVGSGDIVKLVFNYWCGLSHFRPERQLSNLLEKTYSEALDFAIKLNLGMLLYYFKKFTAVYK